MAGPNAGLEPSPLPMFPLETVFLPGAELPLRIFEPRYSQLVTDCLGAADPVFGVVLIAAGREVGGDDKRYDVGALARIVEHQACGGGRYTLRCRVGERIRVSRWLPDDPYPRALVEPWPDEPGDPVTESQISDLQERIVALYERIAEARDAEPPTREMLFGGVKPAGGSAERLYALATRVPMGQADRYSALAAPSAAARLLVLRDALDTVAAMVDFQRSG